VEHTGSLTGLQQSLGGARTPGGLDVTLTKIAVDFQNLQPGAVDATIQASLERIQQSIGCDATCLGLLDVAGQSIDRVLVARSTFTAANPQVMQGESLASWPWLEREFSHLRLLGLPDTARPQPDQAVDAAPSGTSRAC
jgi:hypothetical protein